MRQKSLKKYYFTLLTFLLLTGCGGGESSTNSPHVVVHHSSHSFSHLSAEEKRTLKRLHTTQQKLLEAINKERSESRVCGSLGLFPAVPSLTWSDSLYDAALEHATDLAYSDTFSHNGSGTEYDITGHGEPSKFYERIVYNGYTNYHTVGENIAGGQRSVEEVMRAWMASPGHCANIMKRTYTQVGVAVVIKADSTYQIYWTQNFGSKKG
jgi:uncharacterized protein YkwD